MSPVSLWESERMTLAESIDLTLASLRAYGERYRHWAVAYSGGKDSTALVTLLAHLIEEGDIPRPETLTVLYADTRLELPPLQASALRVLAEMAGRGYRSQVVLPAMDDRFMVYLLGRGVPPPSNTFRWCTAQLKIEPMMAALRGLRDATGEKILMLTGVRLGESAVRDARISLSCGRNGAECGQGWFQTSTPEAVADTLAPLLHWRVCLVWSWLTYHAPAHGWDTRPIAETYGYVDEAHEVSVRTGCVGCNLASRDTALENLLRLPQWEYLSPLLRLRPLYAELKKARNRLRKAGDERRRDGSLVTNPMRMGPLTLGARRWGLSKVLDLQAEVNAWAIATERPQVSLINEEEQARIEALIAARTWPQGWDGSEVRADVLLPEVIAEGIVQPILWE